MLDVGTNEQHNACYSKEGGYQCIKRSFSVVKDSLNGSYIGAVDKELDDEEK